jgi:hypothetical protein
MLLQRSTVLLRQCIATDSRRNISIKVWKEFTPMFTRQLAWFAEQPAKQSFGMFRA